MNLPQMISAALQRRDNAHARGQRILDAATARGTGLNPAEQADFDAALAEKRAAQTKADELQRLLAEDNDAQAATRQTYDTPAGRQLRGGTAAYDRVARTGHEPTTYSRDPQSPSFFADAFRQRELNDPGATARLARHHQEMVTEHEARGTMSRAVTSGGFAGLVVPQYLVDQFALVLRNGRPFANLLRHEPLPEQGMSLIIPRGTTGASVASQTPENTTVSNTDEVWANLTVAVNTIAGQQDVSRQSLERGAPGLDSIVYADLVGAYASELDRQTIVGTGASNQILGAQLTSGVVQATAFAAAVTVTTFILKTAGLVSSLASAGTAIRPNAWLMHPRRWYWLCSQVDTTGRPIAEPGMNGPFNTAAVITYPGGYSGDGEAAAGIGKPIPVGYLHGLPVYIDANVPTSIGTGPEDLVFLVDSSQAILWEDGDGMPTMLKFEQTLGNQLTVKLVVYGYVAATFGRYPTAVGIVGGNAAAGFGLVAPTF